jgi:proteasome lid subunit RPN8/RPN11
VPRYPEKIIALPFSKIVVDHKEEAKFRRRALRRFPKEHIEALWGYVRSDTAYIVAFLICDTEKANTRGVYFRDDLEELDFHEADAADTIVTDGVTGNRIKLALLGTIHSPPNDDDAVLSEFDIRESQETQESIIAVCAIKTLNRGQKNQRRITKIEYWPAIRPMAIERKREYDNE